jgi:hypothetical protein
MSLNLEVSYLDSAYTYSGNMPQSICLSFSHSVLKGEVFGYKFKSFSLNTALAVESLTLESESEKVV